MIQTKAKPTLISKHHVLLASDERCGCTCSRSDAASNQRTLTSRGQRPDQRAATGAAADPSPVPLLVRASPSDYVRGVEQYDLVVHRHPVQGQTQLTWMMQSSRMTREG